MPELPEVVCLNFLTFTYIDQKAGITVKSVVLAFFIFSYFLSISIDLLKRQP